MAINISTESIKPLAAAARTVPGRKPGAGINPATVWRWAMRGVKGVRLETLLVGGTRYTSDEALQRFFEATTAAADGVPAPVATPALRKRAMEAAERRLAADGI